jgi:HK97 family phage major capsid protein
MISYIIEKSLLGRLGVRNVAVQTDTTKYADVTALPTANTIAEGAELTEIDPTFTARTLQMFSYRAGTIITQGVAEDSLEHPGNILEPLTQSIAENIDSDFINGGGSSEPMGLDNMPGGYMRLHLGANGSSLTDYEELGALWQKACDLNHGVSAFVMAPRILKEYHLLETATEEIPKPNPFAEIPMVETVAVGVADTQGTGSNATKIYAGDYENNVWAGWRYGGPDSLKFLVDRITLAEFGKIRIYAYTRCGLAYPRGYTTFG